MCGMQTCARSHVMMRRQRRSFQEHSFVCLDEPSFIRVQRSGNLMDNHYHMPNALTLVAHNIFLSVCLENDHYIA